MSILRVRFHDHTLSQKPLLSDFNRNMCEKYDLLGTVEFGTIFTKPRRF